MRFITQFGDLSVLMPLSFLLGISLWRYETKAAARAFVAALMLCLVAMLIFKLFFLSCGNNLIPNVASPSGHTAASIVVFGSIGLVISTHAPKWSRVSILIAIGLLIIAIAMSRFYIGAHSIPEIVIAFFIGTFSLLIFARNYNRMLHPPLNFWMLGSSFVILTALLYGIQLPTEMLIRKWALLIRTETGGCTAIGTTGSLAFGPWPS